MESNICPANCKIWVQQRIVPPDRQNLGQILKDNDLEEYDEFELLMLADGRCAQDSYYLAEISETVLLNAFGSRYQKRVEDVVPLTDCQLLVFFRDGMIRKCDVEALTGNDRQFAPVIKNREIFCTVEIQTGGYGICWGENLNIPDSVLYETGQAIPLSAMDFRQYIHHRVIDTTEAAKLLNCSRQNIEDLVRREKLHPVKTTRKIKLFLKSEIKRRLWKYTTHFIKKQSPSPHWDALHTMLHLPQKPVSTTGTAGSATLQEAFYKSAHNRAKTSRPKARRLPQKLSPPKGIPSP